MKQIKLKIILVAVGVLLSLHANAYDAVVNGIYYNLNSSSKTAEVTYKSYSYRSYSGKVNIPSSMSYNGTTYSVTSIGNDAFRDCSGLTSITIPNSVTSIGGRAFSGCSGLTSITIPNSVTSIYGGAFYNTPWYNNQPDGMVYAGNVAYTYKGTMPNNTEIIIKDGTTGIAESAFSGCSGLTSITIPNSVTSIGGGAFSGCSGLTSITIPNSVTSIGGSAFYGCSGLTSITIPNGVTSIGISAFSNCRGLTSVTIPNSVTSIGDNAFSWCSGLTSITIPSSVTSIGYSAFSGCSGLTSITIPNSVTSIGNGAFEYTEWLRNQKDGIIYAGKVAYTYKGTMADNTKMVLKDGTIGIAGRAFSGCSGLTSITIPNSVTNIGDAAFQDCSGLTSITIPNSVTSIGISAFFGCSGLTAVIIPNGVTSIGDWAFFDCSGLTAVNIPSSVTSIGNYAFENCSGLTSINIPSSVTSIGDGAFENCSGLTAVNIPNSVTKIGNQAFMGCSGMTSVTIPNSVTKIGDQAFYGCSGLTSINIPNSVTTIGNQAFCNCMSLEAISFSDNITSVGSMAFSSTPWFLNMENGPVYIGKVLYAYRGIVPENAEIVVKEGTVSISPSAFSGRYNLTSITIPNSVTSIGSSAFSGCSGLTSVVSEIEEPFAFGSGAFSSISSSCTLTVPAGTKDTYIAAGWTESIFKGGIVEAEPVNNLASDNYLSIANVEACKGSSVLLPVSMNNTESIKGIQFDLHLPAGVSVATDADDAMMFTLTSRAHSSHAVSARLLANGDYRVVVSSMSARTFSGTEGDIMNITLNVAENVVAGEYEVKVHSIVLNTAENVVTKPADATATLTVSDAAPGDVNGDGEVNVTDVGMVIDDILENTPANFVKAAADVNGDGEVNVTDVGLVIDIILSDDEPAGARKLEEEVDVDTLDPQ